MKVLKKLLLVTCCLLLMSGCGKAPTTKDGEKELVSLKKGDVTHQVTVDELYNVLKDKYGFEELLSIIDTYIFETEFKDYKSTATSYADSYVRSMIQNYESEEAFLSALKQTSNYKSIDDYKDYVYLSYLQSHAMEEYAKSLVTDKQIENYYKDSVKENIDVYHILITPKVKDDMSEKEKTAAEDKAKKKAQDLIKKLNESDKKFETFKTLASESSEDDATKEAGGSLGEINEFSLGKEYDELVKAAYNLKDGEYTTSVVTTELGYHIVYRNTTGKKDKLDDLKEDILDKLANNVMASDANFVYTTMKHYRDLYKLKINDSNLDKSYRNYMNDLLASSKNQKDTQK